MRKYEQGSTETENEKVCPGHYHVRGIADKRENFRNYRQTIIEIRDICWRANYRAACRARSSADFIAKMGIVEEELDESIYWLELLVDSGIVLSNRIALLAKEADELLAITVSSIRTARGKSAIRNPKS